MKSLNQIFSNIFIKKSTALDSNESTFYDNTWELPPPSNNGEGTTEWKDERYTYTNTSNNVNDTWIFQKTNVCITI